MVDLHSMKLIELKELAKEKNIKLPKAVKKNELIEILEKNNEQPNKDEFIKSVDTDNKEELANKKDSQEQQLASLPDNLAEEIKDQNAEQFNQLKVRFSENAMTFVSHEEFKQLTKNVKLFIRTGETTPYSNIILKSGNIFSSSILMFIQK